MSADGHDPDLVELFTKRRQSLTHAPTRTKTAAIVVGAHLDELNVIHDALADAGLLPARDGADDEAIPPYDPARPLTRKA